MGRVSAGWVPPGGPMVVREIHARAILSVSQIYDYALNPYTGCSHGCSYCYARFMKRFSGHREPWGEFVDAKINAPDLLAHELERKKRGVVWVSGVCDAYQPLESRYRLTRQCLELLVEKQWPVRVQTRSPLVTRDIDILRKGEDVEVGLSITTADEEIRRLFEPRAPSIQARLRALDTIHEAGIRTYVMIAPLLPGAEGLVELLAGRADYVLIDRMNYHYGDWVYRQHGLSAERSDEFFRQTAQALASACEGLEIACQVVF
jgi:DNA repair photolyase